MVGILAPVDAEEDETDADWSEDHAGELAVEFTLLLTNLVLLLLHLVELDLADASSEFGLVDDVFFAKNLILKSFLLT